VVLSLSSLGAGYVLGARSSLPCPPEVVERPAVLVEEPAPTDIDEEEDDFEQLADGDLTAISAGFNEPCKLVRVVALMIGN
jgi:PTH2 family peptidyl-tRNA hydrolase